MKEFLKEQNMGRENDPVSTTSDVGLNNNQSPTGSDDPENVVWVPEDWYHNWCENIACVDDQLSLLDYELGWNDEHLHNNWSRESANPNWQQQQQLQQQRTPRKTVSGARDNKNNGRETTDGVDNFWNNTDNRDDLELLNTLLNNDAALNRIAGDSVNQLDSRKNEEKIFYEKPKLNIQTVTYLYDSVLPPTEKCMNYVNSIKLSQSLEEAPTPEDPEPPIEEASTPTTTEEKNPRSTNLNEQLRRSETPESEVQENGNSASWPSEIEVKVDVEVVELTTSVKETLQFPEIEDIPDSVKSSEISDSQPEEIVIDHIDLIREAKELPRKEESSSEEATTSRTEPEKVEVVTSESGSGEGFFEAEDEEAPTYAKLEEIDLLSSIGRDIGVDLEKYVQPVPDVVAMESMSLQAARPMPAILKEAIRQDTNKLADQELPDVSSADTRKKEKMARNQARRRQQSHSASTQNRRPDKRRADHIADSGPGGFDVYNIETAMPKIDLDAIESHLRAAREEERRRRNDREEIRRRLAMGPDAEDLRAERGRKPSLQSRLQSGMNLQICFMNETPSDTESPGSENDSSPGSVGLSSMSKLQQHHSHQLASRPQVLSLPPLRVETGSSAGPLDEADFFARQARLQTEARMALAQAKEMAHMQMEVERQRLKQSPITEMVRSSLEKVGVQLGEDRRRLSRVLLTELNVAQLQVVANDLHARIAMLNEALVEGLLRRDDLHMEQDSMLVDVEDLTRYLGAKQESLKKRPGVTEQHQQHQQHQQLAGGSLTSKSRGGHHHQTPAKTSISREKLLNTLVSRRAA